MDRLEFYLDIIKNNLEDIKRYKNKISTFLPINYKNYEELQFHSKDTLDAIAFRFTKLQSLLGEKVFKLFIEKTGFDTNEKSFLEILSELERLNIVKREEWIRLREIRNKISHEYPEEIDEIIDNLNKIIENIEIFKKIYKKIKEKYEALK